MRGNAPERLVSGSDDFTMFLWEPTISKQPKARMTGHQKVKFLRLLDLKNVLVLVYMLLLVYLFLGICFLLAQTDLVFLFVFDFCISMTADTLENCLES
jgi:hypothetical protein